MKQNGCAKMGGSSCPTKNKRMGKRVTKKNKKKGGMSYDKKQGGSKCPTKGGMKKKTQKKTQKKKKSQKKSKGLFAGLFKL